MFIPPFFINIIFEGNEMLKKLKMTTFAVVLCLFGFVLVPAAPAWAGVSNNVIEFEKCVQGNKGKPVKKVKCFKAVTKKMIQVQQDLCNELKKCERFGGGGGICFAANEGGAGKAVFAKIMNGKFCE